MPKNTIVGCFALVMGLLLVSGSNDAGATSIRKSLSLPNLRQHVSPPASSTSSAAPIAAAISFKRQNEIWEKICAANREHCTLETSAFVTYSQLLELGSKLGYKQRQKNSGDVYENIYFIDISWPTIKEYAEKILTDNKSIPNPNEKLKECLNNLQKVITDFGNIKPTENQNATEISLEQIDDLLKRIIGTNKLFTIEGTEAEKKQITNCLGTLIKNSSGFQRIMSLLVASILNSCPETAFRKDVCTLKIEVENYDGPGAFSLYDQTIKINKKHITQKHILQPSCSLSIEDTLMHEISHAFHYMIGSNIPHQDQTPFFIWSVLNAKEQGYDFLDMFFPPLTDSNMTPVVSEIEKLISDDMITNILKDSSSIHYKNAYALFELIINNGLGSLIFDMNELDALETNNNNWKSNDFLDSDMNELDALETNNNNWKLNDFLDSDMNEFDALETNNNNWKLNDFFDSEKMKKALAKAIYIYSIVFRSRTAKKMSRQIYAHTLAPNSEFKSTDYTTFWNNNEEVITITGITPFLINNSIIAVQDRQNEFIFLDRTPQSILENKYSYRYHASEGDPFHLFVKIQDMLFKLGATQTRLGFFRNVGIALWKAIKKQGIYDTLKKNWNASNKPKEHFYKSPENEKMSDYAKSEKETHISTQIEDKIKELASSKLYIINPLYAINSPNTKKYNNKNSLVLAIEMNATNTQKCLVESDIPDIKNKNLYVATALGEIITGTSSNRIVSIREILDSCPDPKKIVSTVDDKEETVLHRIIYNIVVMGLQEKDTKWKTKRIEENIEIIKLLAKHDIDINTTVIENPLYLAMRINDGCKLEIIETLLNSFPKLANAKDGQNETVLHKAIYNIAMTSVYEGDKEQKTKCIEENIEIIKLLAKHGFDINTAQIENPLYLAMRINGDCRLEIIKALLNSFPELANAKDGRNETVLHKAIDNIAMTSVYEEDKEQKTKRIEENIEIIKLLVERVDISKINIKDLLSILDLTSSEIVAKIKKVILDNCRPEDKKTLLENTNFQEI